MSRLTYLLMLMLFAFSTFSQNKISGNITTENTIKNVERNFIGFNSCQGYLENIYKNFTANSGLEVNKNFHEVFANLSNNISWRFPGGTTANFYNRWASGFGNAGFGISFGDAWNSSNINNNILTSNYGTYSNFNVIGFPNAKTNVIFPFINSISKNRTLNSNTVFCINIINHYRNISLIGYDSRKETLRDTNKVKAIIEAEGKHLDAFNNSTLSKDFKKIVRQNIDAFLTLVNNGVSVYKVEIGNELFTYVFDDNAGTDYNTFLNNSNFFNPSDTKVWIRPDGTPQSIKDAYTTLQTYSRLAKMYKVLMVDTLQKLAITQSSRNSVYTNHLNNIKFGVPVSVTLNGGFRIWDNFMLDPQMRAFIGIDAYIMHPYLDYNNFFKGVSLSAITNVSDKELASEFKTIRDTIEISYNQRFFKQNHINMINALPVNAEIWYTEWNFNFDNNNLKKVGNTMLHAMYYYDAIMNFFDINANKNLSVLSNKTNPIKICNYQLPYAKNDTWYNMTRFKNGYNTNASDPITTTNNNSNNIEYNSTYYAALLLSPVLKDSSIKYLDNKNGGFDKITNCSFRSFYKKECDESCCGDVLYIYFDNKSDSNYTIDLASALKINSLNCVTATTSYLYANNLYASMGQTTFRTDGILKTDTANAAANTTIQRVFNKELESGDLDNILIPKYALGYIKATIKTPTSTCACASVARKKSSEIEVAAKSAPIEPIKIQAVIKTYPNPNTTGTLFIDIPSEIDMSAEIRIFDLTGNLIRSLQRDLFSGDNSLQIDLTDLAKATYIVHISGTNINSSHKIVVQ